MTVAEGCTRSEGDDMRELTPAELELLSEDDGEGATSDAEDTTAASFLAAGEAIAAAALAGAAVSGAMEVVAAASVKETPGTPTKQSPTS